jgi:Secretion system C-terminal sorting domain
MRNVQVIARCHLGVALFLFAFCAPRYLNAQSQQADFFPLSVGNQWSYKYSSLNHEISLRRITSETGMCTCAIITKSSSSDSVRWLVSESHAITRSVNDYISGHDTLYNVNDSTTFEVIEKLSANHSIYRPMDIAGYWTSAFPFPFADDTSRIIRYHPNATEDSIAVGFQKPPTPAALYTLSLTMVRDTGIANVSCKSGDELEIVGLERGSTHVLQSSILTSIPREFPLERPREFALHQNYPNPFNPLTTIVFDVSVTSHARLDIYDLLGRIVANLFDATVRSGSYHVQWNASVCCSGLYFCRLTHDAGTTTIKLSLVK